MCKVLKKLTIAYLALQERANKLQSDKDAMFIENQSLLHKFRKAGDVNRFLQKERNKWFDAHKQIVETNEKATVEQADEMRQLKAENERLRAYVIEKDGIKISDEVQPAPTLQELEKADEATPTNQVLIIKLNVGNDYLQYIVDRQYEKSGDSTFSTNSDPARAQRFLTYSDVVFFLGVTFPMDLVEVFNFDIDTLELEPAARVTPRQVRNLRRQIGVDTENKTMSEGKAPEAIQPVILLSVKDVGYFRFRTPDEPEYLRPTTHDLKRAIEFHSMNEVQNYLGEFPTGDIITTYHHPKTLELIPNPKEPTPF